MSDTFYSWFTVTELHFWMFSTRAMAEGDEGITLRNAMVECMWVDVIERIKLLGVSILFRIYIDVKVNSFTNRMVILFYCQWISI